MEYPLTLDLPAKYLSEELKSRLPAHRIPSYQLQAAVLHHGKKATGGHYSTFTLDTQQPGGVDSSVFRTNGGGCEATDQSPEVLKGVRVAAAAVWRSVNDSKVAVINERQALGASDSVSFCMFWFDFICVGKRSFVLQ